MMHQAPPLTDTAAREIERAERWDQLREQRRKLRTFAGDVAATTDTHPATAIAGWAARTAAWLIEPVLPGPTTRGRIIAAWWLLGTTMLLAGAAIGHYA